MENFINRKKLLSKSIIDINIQENKFKPKKRKHREIFNNNDILSISDKEDDVNCKILSKKFENLQIEKHFKISNNKFQSNCYKEIPVENNNIEGKKIKIKIKII